MSYQYTDRQLNHLNRGNGVYSVNHDYVNQQGAGWKLVTENPEDKDQTNIINTPDQQLRVIDTKVDPETGFDGIAVAPIVDVKVDTSQVIIAYAGTNFDDEHDRDTDTQMVVGGDTSKLSTDTKTVRVGSSTSEFMLNYKGVRNVSSFIA